MDQNQIMAFEAAPVCPDVWRFDDATGATFYLIIGTSQAVVIDTGMAPGLLVPALRQYTQLPLHLLITHGHGDHLCHADEFDSVYLSGSDLPMVPDALLRLGIDKPFDTAHWKDLSGGDSLAFGDIQIRVLGLCGHSEGSVALLDEGRNLLFTGDGMGSGCGVWMQLPGSSSIARYRDSLKALESALRQLPQPPLFLPGHYAQRYVEGGDNPVCMALLSDMIALCGALLDGTAQPEPASEYIVTGEPPLCARLRRASMIYTASKLK